MRVENYLLKLGIIGLLFFCMACGGSSGGGGGGEFDSGKLRIRLSPGTITPGSLGFVSTEFSEIFFDDLDTQGVTLKLVLPNELMIIPGSAALTLNFGAFPITPLSTAAVPSSLMIELLSQVRLTSASAVAAADGFYFVIFAIPPEVLNKTERGFVDFNVSVASRPRAPFIFADLDRGALSTFNPSAADFDAETTYEVQVVRPPREEDEF